METRKLLLIVVYYMPSHTTDKADIYEGVRKGECYV